jgi:hypothetical protein
MAEPHESASDQEKLDHLLADYDALDVAGRRAAFEATAKSWIANDAWRRGSERWESRRQQYAEQYSKTVVPQIDRSIKFVEIGAQYGKQTLGYLFLLNGGGLAALVALHPLVKDVHQAWLPSVMIVAVLFGFGLLLAAVCAAAAYHNQTSNALSSFTTGTTDDLWLRQWYFELHKPSTQQISAANDEVRKNASKQIVRAYWAALGAGVASAAFAAGGGVALAYKLFTLAMV